MALRLRAACALMLLLATGQALEASERTVWRRPLPGWGEPAVDATAAYVLTRSHQVVSLDLRSGQERWRADTGGPGETPLGSAVRLSPASVIVGDDAIVAFDRETGRTHWRFVPVRGHGAGIFLGDVDEDLVVAGSLTGHVHALESATGRLRWTRTVAPGAVTVYQPMLAAGRVIVTYTRFGTTRLDGGIAAFARDGRRVWHVRLPRGLGVSGPPRSAGECVAVARTDGVIACLAFGDGRTRWQARHSVGAEALARDVRPLAVAGAVLVAGSLTGAVTAYGIDDGVQRWRIEGPAGAAPLRLSSDGWNVYAPFTDGTLLALSAADGAERWRTGEPPHRVWWPPGVHGNHVVAVGERTVVACMRPGEGE